MKKLLCIAFFLAARAASAQWVEVTLAWAEINTPTVPLGTISGFTLAGPAQFTITGDNPCTTGNCTITINQSAQAAGSFFGVGFGGVAAPTFQAPAVADGECLGRTGGAWVSKACSAGTGAPSDATYITQTANGTLSAEQALSALSTGIMRVATTTGVITSLTDSAGISGNISDETGSGALVFGTSPSLTTPALGTPSALVLTNATGTPSAINLTNGTALPVGSITGLGTGVGTFLATPTTANFAAAVTGETGTGAVVFGTSPTLVTPALGTPTALVLTSATGLPVAQLTGTATGILTWLATSTSANLGTALTDEKGTTGGFLRTGGNVLTKSISIETPTASEKIPIWNTTEAMTITKVCGVGFGTTPSVTYNIRYGSDLSAAGTAVTTTPVATTSTTTCVDTAALNNAAPAAADHIWLTTTATSGTVLFFNVTISYTIP